MGGGYGARFFRNQPAYTTDFYTCDAGAAARPDRAGLQLVGVIFGFVTATVMMLAFVTVIQQA